METLFILIGIAFALAVITLGANALGYLLTEVFKIPINVKPFNCRGCLAFWLTFGFALILAFAVRGHFETLEGRNVATFMVAFAGQLAGLINYFYVKSKFQIYE